MGLNEEIAARVGIVQIEMAKSAADFGRNMIWVVNRAERKALKKVKSEAEIYAGLASVYIDIGIYTSRLLSGKLNRYSRALLDSVRSEIFNLQESRRSQAKSLFPGVSGADILRIIQNQNVSQRIAQYMAKYGLSPSTVASSAILRGDESIRKNIVAQYFARLREAAYKIGRTSASKAASDIARKTYESIPRSLIGFQIHGILDERIRPKHRERNGTIYYKSPRYGNKGFDQMPNPPVEEDGSIAYNCRCWLSPVISTDSQKFYDFKGRIIPDAKIFSNWFKDANKDLKVAAIGVKRYQKATRRLKKGENLEWYHILEPVSGMLLDPFEIEHESHQKRSARIKKAKKIIFGT